MNRGQSEVQVFAPAGCSSGGAEKRVIRKGAAGESGGRCRRRRQASKAALLPWQSTMWHHKARLQRRAAAVLLQSAPAAAPSGARSPTRSSSAIVLPLRWRWAATGTRLRHWGASHRWNPFARRAGVQMRSVASDRRSSPRAELQLVATTTASRNCIYLFNCCTSSGEACMQLQRCGSQPLERSPPSQLPLMPPSPLARRLPCRSRCSHPKEANLKSAAQDRSLASSTTGEDKRHVMTPGRAGRGVLVHSAWGLPDPP